MTVRESTNIPINGSGEQLQVIAHDGHVEIRFQSADRTAIFSIDLDAREASSVTEPHDQADLMRSALQRMRTIARRD